MPSMNPTAMDLDAITGRISFDDVVRRATLDENGNTWLLAIDVPPFHSIDPTDIAAAYQSLRPIVNDGDVIQLQGFRTQLAGIDLFAIVHFGGVVG